MYFAAKPECEICGNGQDNCFCPDVDWSQIVCGDCEADEDVTHPLARYGFCSNCVTEFIREWSGEPRKA